MEYKFICIEGNIGAGKTSLAKKISVDCNAKLILEQFEENPFLTNFYKNPDRFAFPLELYFMAERYKQLKDSQLQEFFSPFTISDYFFIKSRLFAQNNLNDDELKLFYRLFDIMLASLPKPDLLIYLHSEVDRLKNNIKDRNRSYEQNISDKYLINIQQKYFDFFRKQNDFPVLMIDVSDFDFLKDKEVYNKIKESLSNSYDIGMHKLLLK